MFKCTECGHIFEEGEQAVRVEYHDEIPGGFHEDFVSCPICGGAFEETVSCKKCGGAFLADELIGGYYCDECLKKALTCDSFLGFAKWGDKNLSELEIHTIEHFMLVWIYGVNDDAIKGSSREFRALMMAEFNDSARAYNRALRLGNEDKFLEQIWNYMEDYCLLDGFAEYLHDKEVRK